MSNAKKRYAHLSTKQSGGGPTDLHLKHGTGRGNRSIRRTPASLAQLPLDDNEFKETGGMNGYMERAKSLMAKGQFQRARMSVRLNSHLICYTHSFPYVTHTAFKLCFYYSIRYIDFALPHGLRDQPRDSRSKVEIDTPLIACARVLRFRRKLQWS